MTIELSAPEEVMLKRLAAMEVGPHFRHQTRDEPPLSQEEKIRIAGDLLRRNPGEFLARYYRFLSWPDDAVCFNELWHDYTVSYYLKEVVGFAKPVESAQNSHLDEESDELNIRENLRRRRELQIKNRRLVALRRMEAEANADPTEGFFSHESMRERDPVLWERMVGRHLTDAHRRSLLGHQYESFSGMLLSQLLESDGMPDRRPDDTDEEESDEEMRNGEQRREGKKETEEKYECANKEFRELMYSRFLAGNDSTVDYETIDNDVTLDDELEERGRDAEESYFDSESPAPAPPFEPPIGETVDPRRSE
ncbi:unnamed protein product [Rodentolepis nana]|uniref:DUF2052 domain-containing protein n=1 Tax=Rodentolepis nana TaxID=102285 RepID=A0A0R3T035_RODNA|nr:unnamed protein product [Rodentolepis nana]